MHIILFKIPIMLCSDSEYQTNLIQTKWEARGLGMVTVWKITFCAKWSLSHILQHMLWNWSMFGLMRPLLLLLDPVWSWSTDEVACCCELQRDLCRKDPILSAVYAKLPDLTSNHSALILSSILHPLLNWSHLECALHVERFVCLHTNTKFPVPDWTTLIVVYVRYCCGVVYQQENMNVTFLWDERSQS